MDLFDSDVILANTTTPNQSGPGRNGNKEVLPTPQRSRTGVSPLDSYPRHLFFVKSEYYPLAKYTVCILQKLPTGCYSEKNCKRTEDKEESKTQTVVLQIKFVISAEGNVMYS